MSAASTCRSKDLELHTTQLGDDVSSVEVTGGTVAVNALVDELPLGPLVREVIAEQDVRNETDTTSADLDGLRLVTVRDDDGWHVSLLYTLGELLRHEIDPQPPIPRYGHGTPAVGASSPEEAVRQGVAAATALDLEKLISLTPAEGLEALHDYGPTFAAAVADNESGVTIEDLKLETSDGEDGTKVVTPTAFTVTWDDGYGSTAFVHADGCTTITYDDVEGGPGGDDFVPKPQKLCGRDDPYGSPAGLLGLPLVGNADGLGIVTEQHDGKWFISPTATRRRLRGRRPASHDPRGRPTDRVGVLRPVLAAVPRRLLEGVRRRAPDRSTPPWRTGERAIEPVLREAAGRLHRVRRLAVPLPLLRDGLVRGVRVRGGPRATPIPWRIPRPRTTRSVRRSRGASTRPTASRRWMPASTLPDDPEVVPPVPSGSVPTTTVVPVRPTVPPSTLIPPTTARSAAATRPAPTTSTSTTTVAASTTTAAP